MDPKVVDITNGRQGKLWIGTFSGLHVFDPATQQFNGIKRKDSLTFEFIDYSKKDFDKFDRQFSGVAFLDTQNNQLGLVTPDASPGEHQYVTGKTAYRC